MGIRLSKIAFLLGLVLVIILSLLPPEHLVLKVTTWDKLNHAVAYAMLAFVGSLGFRHGRPILFVAVALLVLGAGLEVAQAAVPNRSPSPFDALANLVGIIVGTALAIVANKARRLFTQSFSSN